MTLLTGPVVFIDDEIGNDQSNAYALLQEILETGRPVATATEVPDGYEARFEHWRSLAFVVVDWDLTPNSVGMLGGDTISAFHRRRLLSFLKDVLDNIYCPVFVVSNENTEQIESTLFEDERFQRHDGRPDDRIAVFPKEVVMHNLIQHLSDWVDQSPALSVLKAWENEHDQAKNRLFADLTAQEPDWPVYIWQAAQQDEVDPGFELASVITTNLFNRLDPVKFDVESITSAALKGDGEALRRVSQGRTTIEGRRLSPKMAQPGDLFRLPDDPDDVLWLNVSPACHTVGRVRTNSEGVEVAEPTNLHLLRGQVLSRWPSNDNDLRKSYGANFNSIVIHTAHEHNPVKFKFGEARITAWNELSDHRISRLLPPFITRVQQLHSAYLQSEGLPRVTMDLYSRIEPEK
jgi:hypothetical protein